MEKKSIDIFLELIDKNTENIECLSDYNDFCNILFEQKTFKKMSSIEDLEKKLIKILELKNRKKIENSLKWLVFNILNNKISSSCFDYYLLKEKEKNES